MSELGAHLDGDLSRFAVFSAHAVQVTLCLFDDDGFERRRIALAPGGDGIWRTEVKSLRPGQLYGYRADGPWEPLDGHRFQPGKLLVDPLARAITGEPRPDSSLYSYHPGSGKPEEHDYNGEDSAAAMPKCVLVDPTFDWQGDAPPGTPWRDTVIYECHVRGLTRRHPEIDEELRGTYLGLVAPPVLKHLRRLGVTALELLPVQQIASEPALVRRGLNNYWGYSPLGFCAPHAGYASGRWGEQVTEFKTMVRELHRAGLEVILDVVFNHTAEGDHHGPVLSLKGLDNHTFFKLARRKARYVDHTGCGNTLDASRSAVWRLILESLRFWVREMHVDGFRFDLATVLGRGARDGFDGAAPFFDSLAADPELARVKLIAEPWDLAPGGYQLGRFPASWAEWNDRFRQGVRRFWRGDPLTGAELERRLAGSRDLFGAKGPLASVNHVTCHDGFTLVDLVSYRHKHTEANGEGNRDGADDNASRNWGHEGPSDDPAVRQLRERARRNLITTLALSRGVPMLLSGDELGRSQNGNNNAYCQDNELSWLDWSAADESFLAFVGHVLKIRRRFPVLRQETSRQAHELLWWHPEGREMTTEDRTAAQSQAFAAVWRGSSDSPEDLLIVFNGSDSTMTFQVPATQRPTSRRWVELLNTARPDASSGSVSANPPPRLRLEAFSLRVFALAASAGDFPAEAGADGRAMVGSGTE